MLSRQFSFPSVHVRMGSPSSRSSIRNLGDGDVPVFRYSDEEVASSLVRGSDPNSYNHDHPSKVCVYMYD